MSKIIKENQRAFLFVNGVFSKMLGAGKQRVWSVLGQELRIVNAEGLLAASEADIAAYLRDKNFADASLGVDVPDNSLAIWFAGGRLKGCLTAGSYRFWNIFEKITYKILDISEPDANAVPREYFTVIPAKMYTKLEVAEGETGILYIDGTITRTLASGTYFFWNTQNNITSKKVDMRIQAMEVPGQEILTADKVSLRLNFVCNFRVTNPVALVGQLRNSNEQIYNTVQLALRQYVGRFRLDELLEQKNNIASFVLEKLQEIQSHLFVEFVDAGLKDIILPGEIRDIMNTVLVAEKKAQANVILRREEVASTRSLLNTAKLLDENATLARLKELETLERIFDKVGSITVNNGDGLLAQLRNIAGVSR